MKKKSKSALLYIAAGIPVGLVNSLLGAGGGMLAVPILKKTGMDQKSAHANAVAVILPITVLSAALYIWRGYVSISDSLIYIPTGLIGAFIGTKLLSKISGLWLRRIFGAFMIYAGVRMVIK